VDTQLPQVPDRRGALRPSPTVLLVEDEAATGGADDRAVKMIRDSQIPWLKKPFTNAELREALEAVLRNANPQPAL